MQLIQEATKPIADIPAHYIRFVPEGQKASAKPADTPKLNPMRGLLCDAPDWTIQVDLPELPPMVIPEMPSKRPDIVIRSCSTQRFIAIELTCCAE